MVGTGKHGGTCGPGAGIQRAPDTRPSKRPERLKTGLLLFSESFSCSLFSRSSLGKIDPRIIVVLSDGIHPYLGSRNFNPLETPSAKRVSCPKKAGSRITSCHVLTRSTTVVRQRNSEISKGLRASVSHRIVTSLHSPLSLSLSSPPSPIPPHSPGVHFRVSQIRPYQVTRRGVTTSWQE